MSAGCLRAQRPQRQQQRAFSPPPSSLCLPSLLGATGSFHDPMPPSWVVGPGVDLRAEPGVHLGQRGHQISLFAVAEDVETEIVPAVFPRGEESGDQGAVTCVGVLGAGRATEPAGHSGLSRQDLREGGPGTGEEEIQLKDLLMEERADLVTG